MGIRSIFASLAPVAVLASPVPVSAQDWQGAWNTNYGQIRLVEDGDYVYGDYHDIGTIEGVLVQNRQVLRAIFTRKDGSKGYVEWIQSGDDGNRISGYWAWSGQSLPSWDGSTGGTKWRGDRTDDGLPPITQFGARRSLAQFKAASSSVYRNWLGKGRVQAATGATAAPTGPASSSASESASAPAKRHEFAAQIPMFADVPAGTMPQWFELRLNRIGLGADEFSRYELYGLAGIYAYCQTPTGSVALKPYYGAPNKVFDRPRANAETGAVKFRGGEATRRFAFDAACLRQNVGRIAVQLQTNLKEKDLTAVTDDKFGYRPFVFTFDKLPAEKKWLGFLAGRGEFSFLRTSSLGYSFKISEKLDNGRLVGEKLYIWGDLEFGS